MEDLKIVECINKLQEDVNRQLQGKVGYKLFFWVIGFIIAFISGITGYLVNMNSNYTGIVIENAKSLSTIQEKVSNLEKQQESIIDLFNKYDFEITK